MQYFYCSELYNTPYAILDEEESRHCVSVLRKKEGETIRVMDGKGGLYLAEIIRANSKNCQIRVVEVEKAEPRLYKLHIAIAPTKNADRLEWFIEKAVELNIDEITPLICRHSERKTVNAERLQRLIVSASKQSIKPWIPVLHAETSFQTFVSTVHQGKKAIATCIHQDKQLPSDLFSRNDDVIILIGPEGDFSKEEIDLAQKNNFRILSLGPSRLRTETAGLTACMAIYLLNA